MIPGAALPRLAECRDCHKPIRFVRMTHTGRQMPVNPRPETGPEAHGTVAARLVNHRLEGHVITDTHPAEPVHRYRFRPHHATCEARGRTTTTHTEPDPALF